MNLMDPSNEPRYLTPAEAAKRLRVSPITVRSWANKGMLVSETTAGGHRRYREEEVDRFSRLWNPNGNKQRPLRILIVDDDKPLVGFLKELFGDKEGQTILETASDGFEAGQKVHTFQPDVVLLDLMMPGIKGTEVCRRIKALPGHARMRVLAMSGYLTLELEQELLDAGAERCFTKPLDTKELLRVLDLHS
jgi:excisionase family DNA binding protein